MSKFCRYLTGQRFGKLTITAFDHKHDGRFYWSWKCDCGNTGASVMSNITAGKAKSCGRQECSTHYRHGLARRGHLIPEYDTWSNMKARCYAGPSNSNWSRYGGRGIQVCERWLTFKNFIEDMGRRPSSDYTLDRIEVDGDYCPENCRWATQYEQSRNRSDNVWIEAGGRRMILADWGKELGCPGDTIQRRIKHYGWTSEKAVLTPIRRKRASSPSCGNSSMPRIRTF